MERLLSAPRLDVVTWEQDEPTTGLDSATAFVVVKTIKRLQARSHPDHIDTPPSPHARPFAFFNGLHTAHCTRRRRRLGSDTKETS